MSYMKKLSDIWVYLLCLVIWQISASVIDKPILFPYPSTVIETLFKLFFESKFQISLYNTIASLSLAWIISIIFLTLVFFLSYSISYVKIFFNKISYLMQPLPTFSLLPIAMILFGINQNTVNFLLVFSTFWVGIGVLISSMYETERQWNSQILNLKWSKLKSFILVFIPSMLPTIVSVMKLVWSLMFRTIIAIELTFGTMGSSWNLGRFMLEEKNNLNISEIYAVMLVTMIIGIFVNKLFDAIKEKVSW